MIILRWVRAGIIRRNLYKVVNSQRNKSLTSVETQRISILSSNIPDLKMMILGLKLVSNCVHARFRKTLMFSGKESSKWLMTPMFEFERESSILSAMVVLSIWKRRCTKLCLNSITTKIQISEELATRWW